MSVKLKVYSGDIFPDIIPTFAFPELFHSYIKQVEIAKNIVKFIATNESTTFTIFTNSPIIVKGIIKFKHELNVDLNIKYYYDNKEIELNELFGKFYNAVKEIF